MPGPRFGLVLPTEFHDPRHLDTYVADANRALRLAAGHFESAWMVDHLQFGETAVLEGFTALTYLAALHPQFKFGHTVVCQSFRNPALLAKMATTLQVMSGGRYALGLGAGWHAEEYAAYGYEYPSDGVRVAQLAEAIQIIRAMWSGGPVTFSGQHYRVAGAYCHPRPQPAPPIIVGAFKPRMLRLAARYADGWNVSSTSPRDYAVLAAEFEQACADVGRDPATVRRSWVGGCACAPTQAQAVAQTEGRWSADSDDDFGFAGTPRQVIAQFRQLVDLGVDEFMLDCAGFPDLATLELLIGEVLPAFQG